MYNLRHNELRFSLTKFLKSMQFLPVSMFLFRERGYANAFVCLFVVLLLLLLMMMILASLYRKI